MNILAPLSLPLIFLVVFFVGKAAASDACSNIEPTNAESMKLTGQPLVSLPPMGLSLLKAVVEAERIGTERVNISLQYQLEGLTGEAATKSLESQGFECHVEILDGVATSSSGLSLRAADLPTYSCTIRKPETCYCHTFKAAFGPGPQFPRQPVAAYRVILESMVLDQKSLSYHCLRDKSQGVKSAPDNSLKTDTVPAR
ncbi:MAG: hypothetical protein K0S46_2673 [Moraxellaceae bacterium]|jgi:hypothetical protein|nr:hypothetical protein [Moraxellaceae bacterium]